MKQKQKIRKEKVMRKKQLLGTITVCSPVLARDQNPLQQHLLELELSKTISKIDRPEPSFSSETQQNNNNNKKIEVLLFVLNVESLAGRGVLKFMYTCSYLLQRMLTAA